MVWEDISRQSSSDLRKGFEFVQSGKKGAYQSPSHNLWFLGRGRGAHRLGGSRRGESEREREDPPLRVRTRVSVCEFE